MANQLYATVTGCSGIESISVSDSHTAPTATANITCMSSSLDVGDHVTVNLGYTSNHDRVFSGYVKNVQRSQSPTQYEITCANAMVRAIDFFIVSNNPLTPYSKENIKAEDLVGDLMAMAGLTNYHGDNTSFTFATAGYPVEVNLVSSYDFSKMIADLLAWHIYADNDGAVHFLDRKPYPDGDSSVATLDDSNLLNVGYFRSDRDLRNKVVVYGSEGVYAKAQASSPYLPAGFYKSVVVASPSLIQSTSMAQAIANYNLAKLNRLTIGGTATIIGDSSIACRDCVEVNKADIGMSDQFYVFGLEHQFGKDGFQTSLDLRK
jgi:hypothetical protein